MMPRPQMAIICGCLLGLVESSMKLWLRGADKGACDPLQRTEKDHFA